MLKIIFNINIIYLHGNNELVCYFGSLHGLNIIKDLSLKYHVYALLIQDIKDLIEQGNVSVIHTLHERNQCVDFMAKLGAFSNLELLPQDSPPSDLLSLLESDAARIFFLRDQLFCFFSSVVVFFLVFP